MNSSRGGSSGLVTGVKESAMQLPNVVNDAESGCFGFAVVV